MSDFSAKPIPEWEPPKRIKTALCHTAFALCEARREPDTWYLSEGVSLIWRKHLGPGERSLLLASAIKACDPGDAMFLRDALNQILDEVET